MTGALNHRSVCLVAIGFQSSLAVQGYVMPRELLQKLLQVLTALFEFTDVS